MTIACYVECVVENQLLLHYVHEDHVVTILGVAHLRNVSTVKWLTNIYLYMCN